MIECNIYSGRKGQLDYQLTDNFETLLAAELYAQELAELDATEYDYDDAKWLAVETEEDNIPYDDRVGVNYM